MSTVAKDNKKTIELIPKEDLPEVKFFDLFQFADRRERFILFIGINKQLKI